MNEKQLNSKNFLGNILKLPSGLTVIHQYLPSTPVVAVDVWVKAGVMVEPPEWSGMAHFLEHMIFKGTKNILPGEFDFVVESMGGCINAATSHDYAHFFLNTASTYLSETLPYFGEILLQAAIPDEEFLLEREVVLEEINSSYDDPDWVLFQALSETLYQHHPYRKEILGIESILKEITPNQMRCFHKTYYQPENMTVVMVGNVKENDAFNLIQDNFDDFSIRSESPKVTIDAESPLIGIRRTELSLPRLEHSRLCLGWIGASIDYLEEAIALDLLSVILASGRTSRLVNQLREEKQLVLDISSNFSLQKDSSIFTINTWLDQEYLNIVEKLIKDEIYNLQTKQITEKELIIAKRSLCNDYIFSTETPSQLASLYGYYQTISSVEKAVKYPEIVTNLSANQLKNYANQYLSCEHYAITILKPIND